MSRHRKPRSTGPLHRRGRSRQAPFGQGGPPDLRRGAQVGEHLTVVGLEGRDHLEDEQHVGQAGAGQGVQDPAGVDEAGGVPLRGERPVVVAQAIGLLELDLGDPRPEALQPGVRIAVRGLPAQTNG